MSFKSSLLYSVYIVLKCWGLDWLVPSHNRISVGSTHGSFWVTRGKLPPQPTTREGEEGENEQVQDEK